MKKEELPEPVLKAYNKWDKAEQEFNSILNTYSVEYKKADAKSRRAYNAFAKACLNHNLNPMQVNSLFIPTTMNVNR